MQQEVADKADVVTGPSRVWHASWESGAVRRQQ
eukprot:CAMPEP_0202386158 /NCGR_PEP_ID=MMETSP1127-20130417/64996_1 /ASSEMBLY_ACC=CAM_ASM_000462 /TAXON_ID=3047 /ORGANISM="Dunaliella tertiolecta, Strain CCMP1320" /LENGTH=32 /DNA_ID= /DNA_START= /DNA_END= /DNA_ORIENTATION=